VLSFRINNQFVLIQEFTCDFQGLVQVASRIVPKIKDNLFHSLFHQICNGAKDFGIACHGKPWQFDIPGQWICHIGHIHTVDRNLVPYDGKVYEVIFSITLHVHIHLGALGSLEKPYYGILVHLYTGNDLGVDFYDLVPWLQAHFLWWSTHHDIYHGSRIAGHIENNAYSFYVSTQFFIGSSQFIRWKVNGVWV